MTLERHELKEGIEIQQVRNSPFNCQTLAIHIPGMIPQNRARNKFLLQGSSQAIPNQTKFQKLKINWIAM